MEEPVKQRPMSEIRRLVAESNARFDRIGEVWSELTDEQQEDLAMQAEAMSTEND